LSSSTATRDASVPASLVVSLWVFSGFHVKNERFKRSELPEVKSQRTALWSARSLIVLVAMFYAWYTWGHWGDLQADCGREMYVPTDILRGKVLYRDIWYQYGPIPPYVQALAFALIGINLNTLYAIGLILVIVAALLLFEIGYSFQLALPAAIAPALFFLAESFRPSIFNFIFPYTYAASMAAVFGLAFLYFAVRHAISGQLCWLVTAAICTSLALLTKQEFGLACIAALGFESIASCWNRRSWRALISNSFACAAGLIPALVGYGLIVWKVSARTIFIDNWVMTPGTYTMRTIGRYRMQIEGMRFGFNEWRGAAIGAAISLILWFVVGYANAFVIRKLKFERPRHFVLVVITDIVAALIIIKLGSSVWTGLPGLLGQMVFPKGLFLIGCVFMINAIWKVWRTRGQAEHVAEAVLGVYAVVVSIRVMMEMLPTSVNYAVFFNEPMFIVFVIILVRIVSRAGASLDVQRRNLLVGSMLSAEAVLIIIGFFPARDVLSARMKTDFGTIYTKPDRAVLFPQIVFFMKTHTRSGRDILVLPESPSLYFFSGMQSPTRWYEAQPGVLDPKQELTLIDEANSAHVQYVLLCNRHVDEFGVAPFGIGYDQSINKWIVSNYTKIGQFGPRGDLLSPNNDLRVYQPYVMEVYARKGDEIRDGR
jgi:hypothetical protein